MCGKQVLVFGAGSGGVKVAEALESMGYKVAAFLDNSSSKWGKCIHGIQITAPEEAVCQYPNADIVIASIYHAEIMQQLTRLGIPASRVRVAEELFYEEINASMDRLKGFMETPTGGERMLFIEAVQGLGLGGIEQWTRMVAGGFLQCGKRLLIITNENGLSNSDPLSQYTISFDFREEAYLASVEKLIAFLSSHLPCTLLLNRINQVYLAAHVVKHFCPDQLHMACVVHSDFERFYRHCHLASGDMDTFLCVSSRIRRRLMEDYHIDTPALFLRSPVEADKNFIREVPKENTPLHIGYAARIEKGQKRCELLLPLLTCLDELGLCYSMEIAGDGSYFAPFKEELESRGLMSSVTLLGQLDGKQMKEFWKRQEVFVSVSEVEGCALSMLEAMSYGVVPVVTDVSGAEDFIIDGENGFIVGQGDVGRMAERINVLARDKEFLKRAGELCRERILAECRREPYIESLVDIIHSTEKM